MTGRQHLFGVVVPGVLGLIAMAVVVLPGTASTMRIWCGFATFLGIGALSGWVAIRHLYGGGRA